MATPVKATPNQAIEGDRPAASEDQGSYPEEISREQFAWLNERAAERRKRWTEHAKSLADNQKS